MTCPSQTPLTFEWQNKEAGNSPDAVVYIPEDKHLVYKGTQYAIYNEIPEGDEIKVYFDGPGPDNNLMLERKHSEQFVRVSVYQYRCRTLCMS